MKTFVKKLIPYQIAVRLKKTKQLLISLLFKGNRYECPFCGGKYRKFLSGGENLPFFKDHNIIGGGRRSNMLCPRCHSTDRDRLIYYYLTSTQFPSSHHYTLLHIAPEQPLKKYLKKFPNITYYCGDKFEKGYDGFYYDKETLALDITSLSFSDNSFDIIICNHVLEHIIEESKALNEIHRVLKPNGWAILQVPIASALMHTIDNPTDSNKKREYIYGQHDHVRLYGLDYPSRLKAHGFKVEEWSSEKQFNQIQIKRFALNSVEKVFIVSKTKSN